MKASSGFTLIEALSVLAMMVVMVVVMLPVMQYNAQESQLKQCNDNLGQIVMAMTVYQEPNGDFFPAHSQYMTGKADNFKPMPSMAILYPGYVDRPKIFGCPSTEDRPFISIGYKDGARWACFGTDRPDDENNRIRPATNPAAYSGQELSTNLKSSYLYDEFSHFRDIGPSQAMAVDADGQTWLNVDGTKPVYPQTWTRKPQKPNHDNGQNVMYFDGHVKWAETVYASDDPKDNIFCPNGGNKKGGQWGRDTDAYLWDGVNARTVQSPE